VAAGPSHTCLRKTDDTIWCWGWNRHGTVGNNTIDLGNGPDVSHYNPSLTEPPIGNPVPTPVPVVTADGTPLKATALAASHAHTCAIVGASQHLWCWGNNLKGQSGLTTPFSKVAAPMFSCGY
jgi:alpha-tubulin suppressor-like RCC1 family protein